MVRQFLNETNRISQENFRTVRQFYFSSCCIQCGKQFIFCQNTCIGQVVQNGRSPKTAYVRSRPCVYPGEFVEKGQVIADSTSTSDGAIALGANTKLGVMSFEGFDYDDSILVNERYAQLGYGTTLHLTPYDLTIREYKNNEGNEK